MTAQGMAADIDDGIADDEIDGALAESEVPEGRALERGGAPVIARVAAVQAFPVKSMDAAPAGRIELAESGVVGDRGHAVHEIGENGEPGEMLTAAELPRLRWVVAGLEPDGAVSLAVPGSDDALTGSAADQALSAWLDRPLRVVAVEPGSQLEAPVHLVTRQALEAADRGEHEAADCACSLDEPRANLVLDAEPSGQPTSTIPERGWVGATLRVGDALLRIVRHPDHCLGVYAEVLEPGTVQPGDDVRLADQQDVHQDVQQGDQQVAQP